MSRYNSGWYAFKKPFMDLFFLLIVLPLFILSYLVLALIYDTDVAEEKLLGETTGGDPDE